MMAHQVDGSGQVGPRIDQCAVQVEDEQLRCHETGEGRRLGRPAASGIAASEFTTKLTKGTKDCVDGTRLRVLRDLRGGILRGFGATAIEPAVAYDWKAWYLTGVTRGRLVSTCWLQPWWRAEDPGWPR